MKIIQMSELISAIVQNNAAKALQLIPLSDINYVKFGSTSLSYACMMKMTDVAMAIMATGQSIPEHHNKALMYAKIYNMTEVINALVNYDNYIASLNRNAISNPVVTIQPTRDSVSHQSNTISNETITMQSKHESVSHQSDGIISSDWTDITPDHPYGKIIIVFVNHHDCQINISSY